ncbi:MAG: hypothetical protein ACREAA_20585 [Candidatus Polarisedimenticolia bacterium]
MAKSWMSREIKTLRRSLHALATAFEGFGEALGRVQTAASNGNVSMTSASAAPTRRKMTITPKRRAALKLQGRYMGTMRGLKPRQRAQMKKIKEAKGMLAAIRAAERMA